MFNKSGVFSRNDPLPRREATPATGAAAPAPMPAFDRSPASAANAPTEVAEKAVPATKPTQPSLAAAAPATARTVAEKPSTEPADPPVGARLIVGPDVKLKGAEILDCDTLVVEGRVEATMDSRVIRIAENGAFCGNVSIDVAEIHGTFEGELTARSRLVIHSTGRVNGTIRYGSLVAEEGCELSGNIGSLSAAKAAGPTVHGLRMDSAPETKHEPVGMLQAVAT